MTSGIFFRIAVVALAACVICPIAQARQKPNTLTPRQEQEGWKLLFNGKNLNGWHSYGEHGVGKDWSVHEGSIQLKKPSAAKFADFADLVTDEQYTNFDLKVDWRAKPGIDSGIMFDVHESPKYHQTYQTGPEMQIADLASTEPDSRTLLERAGDMFGLIPVPYEWVMPAGQWNHYEIIVDHGHVQFFMEGHRVVDTQLWTPEWKQLVSGSKFAHWPGFAAYHSGHISLQGTEDKGKSHVKLWFRNIMVRKL
ncbi:MAG: 3-keto-disaccharide hydrolase [Limisphaerales bacterium]